ncbi:PQQ-binding-like beta-propeller repeat protein (plasmid) [Streptomyces atratus]|uniref:Outer membrane protein assembly factor BamB, contains PQQ-like beta-propeller repeat n=1 Tax=Streptomyces atratus TaxID=1893 RepID=A0A1K2A3H2_STRAR|nr:PQQ-binding-like beta-propeller repeat protein [Streptomyces atratus]SFX80921.1 Outer membrane protein assembly factor BamB, contains PQQ-like beta-propeller repeat [Streptomyces atratus]
MGSRTGRMVSRRQILRLTGTGLGLAVFGAGVVGCGPEEEADVPGGSATPGGDRNGDTFTTPPPGTAPEPLWKANAANTGLAGNDALAAIGDVVLVSGDPLVGRDIVSGKEKWSRKGVTTPGAKLIVGGGTLYLASAEYDGDVVGLDPATGKETWRSRLGKKYEQPRPIAADDRHVYVLAGILEKDFTTPNNVIAAIDTTSGRIAWREQRDAGTEEFGITAAAVGGRLVYTDYRENVTVRDTATGRQLWTKKISRSNNRRFAVHEGLVIVADGRRLRAFDLVGGKERWSLRTEEFSSFNDPHVLDGVLYAADSARGMWAVDPGTGKRIWRNEDLRESATQAWQFAKVKGTLYGATEFDEDGGVHAFDAATGKLRWTYNDHTGDIQQWYVVAAGDRLAAMHGKRLYALPAV